MGCYWGIIGALLGPYSGLSVAFFWFCLDFIWDLFWAFLGFTWASLGPQFGFIPNILGWDSCYYQWDASEKNGTLPPHPHPHSRLLPPVLRHPLTLMLRLTYPPPCRWARSWRVLKSFAKSPEPQSSVLRSLLGARSPNSQIFLGFPREPWGFPRLVA